MHDIEIKCEDPDRLAFGIKEAFDRSKATRREQTPAEVPAKPAHIHIFLNGKCECGDRVVA